MKPFIGNCEDVSNLLLKQSKTSSSKSYLKSSLQSPTSSIKNSKKIESNPTVASTPQLSGGSITPLLNEQFAVQPRIVTNILSHSLLSLLPRCEVENDRCKFCIELSPKEIVNQQIFNKYELTVQNIYNVNLVNDLMVNSETRLTSAFKEHLIYDDTAEVLQQFYDSKTSRERIKDLTELYDKSYKVFPNFFVLDEKKYMFKNIQRKQKLINQRGKQLDEQKEILLKEQIFSNKFLAEITMRCSRIAPANDKNNLADLVNKFIDKDSLSLIRISKCEGIECSLLPNKPSLPKTKVATSSKKPKAFNLQSTKNLNKQGTTTKKLNRRCESQKKIETEKQSSGRSSANGKVKETPQSKVHLERNTRPFITSRQLTSIDPLQININLNLILGNNQLSNNRPYTSTDLHTFKHQNRLNSPKGETVKKLGDKIKPSLGKKMDKPITVSSTKNAYKKTIKIPTSRPTTEQKSKRMMAIDKLCKDVRDLLSTAKTMEGGLKKGKVGVKKNEIYFHQKTNSDTTYKRLSSKKSPLC